jgi:DNA polymerase-4
VAKAQRKIIHIDMDCFYAAVEARENPMLKGKPLAVGGSPNGRGVVAACSYEARAFGVHSAMPMATAFRQCPPLIRVPVNMPLYKTVSNQIRSIFHDYTDLVQPLSLDEAYLDVTGSGRCKGSASLIALEIRKRILETTGLTASAGVAPNKLVAKIASDWQKPNGQTVVPPSQVLDFMTPLEVKRIHGVGKVTTGKMHKLGLYTCADLQTLSQEKLTHHFGSWGGDLYYRCRGIDNRPVTIDGASKSLSIEDTYEKDLPDLLACLEALNVLFESFLTRLQREQDRHKQRSEKLNKTYHPMTIKALVVKVRFSNFVTTTAQAQGDVPDIEAYKGLCEKAFARGQRPVRLLGLGVMFAEEPGPKPIAESQASFIVSDS